ncbi:unnamed protein product [Brachionus calyciflorus]|uniref:Uncharacterized protein n=1 Tax=Brachionus calyciflorus TaxID=104777 RepID=A0A814FLF4_9BILA|nr:unnamed protein product [Brachionus calyciflorus]
MEYKIVTPSRNGQALYFQNQLYYKLKPKDPVTGVIRWRCLLSINSQHEKHTEVKESQVLMMNAKQQVKENVAKNKEFSNC